MYDHKFPFRERVAFSQNGTARDCKMRCFSSLPLPNHEIRVPFTTRGILHVAAACVHTTARVTSRLVDVERKIYASVTRLRKRIFIVLKSVHERMRKLNCFGKGGSGEKRIPLCFEIANYPSVTNKCQRSIVMRDFEN